MPITEGGTFSPVDRIVSPGVFTRENDLSGIAQGVADIGGAIVAPFPKGPAFTPTLIRSVTDLEEKFGVADGVYYGPYTAKEYLIERGLVTICRVGALTGYKQNYPYVIWAIKGTYGKENTIGNLDTTLSYMSPTVADTYTNQIIYLPATSGSIPHSTTSSLTVATGSSTPYGLTTAQYFKVAVVDILGNEGSASTVSIQSPVGAGSTYYESSLTWTAVNYAGGYHVYSSTSPTSGFKALGIGTIPTLFITRSVTINSNTSVSTRNLPSSATALYSYDTSVNSGSFYFNIPVVLTFAADAADATIGGGTSQTSGSTTYAGKSISLTLTGSSLYSNIATGAKTYITSSIQGSITSTADEKVAAAIANSTLSGSFVTAGVTYFDDTTGNYLDFETVTLVSGSWNVSSTVCGTPVVYINGLVSGSFGKYNGTFTPYGTFVPDPCETGATSSADYRVLAVLADTQNGTISDLVAPGFLGSYLYQGKFANLWTSSVYDDNLSSSISKEFALKLIGSTSTTPYGTYQFSLDSADPKYITNVFGDDPTAGDPDKYVTGTKKEAAYLYKLFENQIEAVMADNSNWKITGSWIPAEGSDFFGDPMNFTDDWSRNLTKGDSTFSITHATTPWIISQAVSSWDGTGTATRFRLFKVHTLADGTDTNTTYKVEVSNVKLAGQVAGSDWGSFTLSIRKYSDTDKKPVILETFQNLNLDPDSSNYIARRIGDRYNYINFAGKIIEFGTYSNNSKYIRIEMATTPWPTTGVPAGFEAFSVPIDGQIGQWCIPMRYSRASLYGVDPGKYASGIAFNDAPTGADSELSALYPLSSTGNGVADDNKQYFAPIPAFGAISTLGLNTTFALDQKTTEWGWGTGSFDKPASTGSFLAAELSGSIPFIYDGANETTYVKMRKFQVGFQGGFDGQSPAIPINVGSDIIPGNTQGLDCTSITSAGSIAYKQCVGALGNADEFDIDLIVTPGIVHMHHPYVTNLVVDMCEKRGDCFYIMDLHVTPATEGSVTQIDEVVGYAKMYDTNYAAAYYPWVKILDTNTNKIIRVPPSVVLPAIYAASDKTAAEWFAPAGLNRGGITQAVQTCDRTTHEERDTLYEGKVNPIAAFPGQNICVWGQKTLQNAASALDRINVRRLLIKVKKFFASTSKYLVFEQNVASTRNKFLAIVNPYLESIQQRSGLYAFQVVMDDTNNTADLIDRNILYGQIYLKPTRTAEFIILDFNILATGASFPSI